MRRALIILSGNLSTTPRAIKNIEKLQKQYDCKIISVNRSKKWYDKDLAIIKEKKLNVKFLQLGRKPLLNWILNGFIQLSCKILYTVFKKSLTITTFASDKSAILIWHHLRKLDLTGFSAIYGHSSGAIYPSWKIGKKWNIPVRIDIEDYHPGEFIEKGAANEIKRRENILKTTLSDNVFVTFASPLIKHYTINLIGRQIQCSVVLNSFNACEFIEPRHKNENIALRFVWFSQYISYSRGLEQFLSAIKKLTKSDSNIEVTLIGDLDLQFKVEWIDTMLDFTKQNSWLSIKTIPAISQKELHLMLADFDIGLALEFNTSDLNRQLCLTNKIIAYSQAGLYVMATDTPAQLQFIEEDIERGIVCGQSVDEMATAIQQLVASKNKIRSESMTRFEKGKELAYDKELINNRI